MIEYKKATEENIDDIIDLRIIYLIEYNTFLEDDVISVLRKKHERVLNKTFESRLFYLCFL